MNKPFLILVMIVAVLVAGLLGLIAILSNIDDVQIVDAGVKIGLILAVVLVAGLAIGMLSRNRDGK